MQIRLSRIVHNFYKAGYHTVHHDGIEHAGYLAFLGLLSFFPFLVFLVSLLGLFGKLDMVDVFAFDIVRLLPSHVVASLEPRINEIVSGPPQGLLTISIIGVIWTASSAVEGLRTILNRAYRVATPPSYLFRRLLSIGQFMGLTLAVIMAMFLLVIGPVFMQNLLKNIGKDYDDLNHYWSYFRYGFGGSILFISVAISYYILPNIKQTWRAVFPGTFVVIVAWFVAASLFSAYLRNFDQVNLVYGSLGGIIATLLFFYIVGVIYIYGAEFNYVFDRSLGYRFVPKEDVPQEVETPEDENSDLINNAPKSENTG